MYDILTKGVDKIGEVHKKRLAKLVQIDHRRKGDYGKKTERPETSFLSTRCFFAAYAHFSLPGALVCLHNRLGPL